MGASRRFSPKRKGFRAYKQRVIKDAQRQQREANRQSAEVAAQYQRALEDEAVFRDAFAVGFAFAWLVKFAETPGVLEVTDVVGFAPPEFDGRIDGFEHIV
jgi:hypothetical protein